MRWGVTRVPGLTFAGPVPLDAPLLGAECSLGAPSWSENADLPEGWWARRLALSLPTHL